MGVLSRQGLVIPKFSPPPSGETMRQTPKRFRGARTCSRSSITVPSLVGLGFHTPPGPPKTLSFLSVCLLVCPSCFWMSEIVHLITPWRHWSTERILIPLDSGRFVVVHPCSTFSDCCQLATPLNAEVPKTAKNWGFPPTEGDRINRSRRNLAIKRTPSVSYSTPNLALIGKRGLVQEPQKCQNLPKIVVFGTGSRHNEHIQMKFGL